MVIGSLKLWILCDGVIHAVECSQCCVTAAGSTIPWAFGTSLSVAWTYGNMYVKQFFVLSCENTIVSEQSFLIGVGTHDFL